MGNKKRAFYQPLPKNRLSSAVRIAAKRIVTDREKKPVGPEGTGYGL